MTRILLLIFCTLSIHSSLQAQKATESTTSKIIRCGTMEAIDKMKAADPNFETTIKANYEAKLRAAHKGLSYTAARPSDIAGINDVVVVPIVFHVVGTAANQAFASEAGLQRQVDVLNLRFGGLNPDSVNIPAAFKPFFGHTKIRFCLAKRTPNNTATNGIERRVSTQTYTSGTVNSLKQTALGGLDQWDGDKYFNIWVANFTDGLLGIATFPSLGPANLQGVAIHYGSIDQPCNSPFVGEFDAGLTLVHEAGHYFYLYHIWGDDGGACTGDDFRLGFGPLPATCGDDTPNQAGNTSGCFSGVATDACSTTAPGFMYQNYMDYSNDGCMYLFTKGQACRMDATLDLYRSSFKTSNGCEPITAINNDVRISEIINPNSRGYACGAITLTCSNIVTPTVLIINDGDAPLTATTFQIKIDNVIVATQSWTGSLAPADFAYIPLTGFTSPPGSHILSIKSINPNGVTDGRPNNDSLLASYRIIPIVNLPIPAESFQATTFPPLNWRIQNPDGALTWTRTTTAGNPGNASARIDCYNYNAAGQIDYLVSPNISTIGFDSLAINFNVAYAKYSNNRDEWDILEVVYTEDCGQTWKPTSYAKSGNALATNGGTTLVTAASFVPTASQWRQEAFKIGLCGVGPTINIGFKCTNKYGQTIYLDNIEFAKYTLPDPNIALNAVTLPNGIYCTNNFQPKVLIANKGNSTITSFTINYNVDGGAPAVYNWAGSLPKCSAPLLVTLPQINVTTGNHTFNATVSAPNNLLDVSIIDNSFTSIFSVVTSVTAPVSEGFESNVFPPTNWAIQNFNNRSNIWQRDAGVSSLGLASMKIKNFNNPNNSIDSFVSPKITINNADSAFVSFDYAYAQGVQYPGSTIFPLDTLEILLSNDCGITSTSIWKKFGYELQTQSEPNYAYQSGFVPTYKNQWRNAKIDIVPFMNGNTEFQIYFVSKSNKQNNLYIDNINIYGKSLPQKLKDQGYLIYPNPFNTSFLIHHSAIDAPTNLQSVQMYNAAGQLVWEKRYQSNAERIITVNTQNLAKGVYVLKLLYTDKTIVEKVVKN